MVKWACAICVVMSGCTVSVRGPSGVVDPATVYLVDYGDTARLWLPVGDQTGYAEWCYGDWAWYAKDEQSLPYGLIVLFVPTQGALGRTMHASGPDGVSAEEVHSIIVERTVAEALGRRLQARFNGSRTLVHVNHARGITFVPDERDYWLANQSTSTTSDWLRALGCQVDGFAIVADYEIKPPR